MISAVRSFRDDRILGFQSVRQLTFAEKKGSFAEIRACVSCKIWYDGQNVGGSRNFWPEIFQKVSENVEF